MRAFAKSRATRSDTGGALSVDPVDPVEEYVAALSGALRGPARAKARLVDEIRDGLTETLAAHERAGADPASAAREAVREFGSPDELVPGCQQELTVAQARHTARAVVLTAPFLLLCWYLVRGADPGHEGPVSRTAQLLMAHLAGFAGAAALLAAGALAVTGGVARRLPTPDRLPLTVAWTGTAAGSAMAVATLALATAALLADNWPLVALACALAAASHAAVATSARACRRCVRP